MTGRDELRRGREEFRAAVNAERDAAEVSRAVIRQAAFAEMIEVMQQQAENLPAPGAPVTDGWPAAQTRVVIGTGEDDSVSVHVLSRRLRNRGQMVEVVARAMFERDENAIEVSRAGRDVVPWAKAVGFVQSNYRADAGSAVDAVLAYLRGGVS